MAKALVELLGWLGLRALGADGIAVGVILFGMGVYCVAIAFGPKRWYTDSTRKFDFSEEFPYFTRAMYLTGAVFIFGLLYMLMTQ